jgi:hypothetical protein
MVCRQQEVGRVRARAAARDVLAVVIIERQRRRNALLADVVDRHVLLRIADGRPGARLLADEALAEVDQHVHVAAADVVRVDLVAAEDQLVRPLVGLFL